MWSASRPGRFTRGEVTLGALFIRDWLGPGAGFDTVKRIKKSLTLPDPNPGRLTCTVVTVLSDLPQLHQTDKQTDRQIQPNKICAAVQIVWAIVYQSNRAEL